MIKRVLLVLLVVSILILLIPNTFANCQSSCRTYCSTPPTFCGLWDIYSCLEDSTCLCKCTWSNSLRMCIVKTATECGEISYSCENNIIYRLDPLCYSRLFDKTCRVPPEKNVFKDCRSGNQHCINNELECECNSGFKNCNSNQNDGCETNILTNRENCGDCGISCVQGESCNNGECVPEGGRGRREPQCECDSCATCNEKLNDPSCEEVTLTDDIGGDTTLGFCLNIDSPANGKTLNCDNNEIDERGASVFSTGVNIKNPGTFTIKNCIIKDWDVNLAFTGQTVQDEKIILDNLIIKNSNEIGILFEVSRQNVEVRRSSIINNPIGIGFKHAKLFEYFVFNGNTICENTNKDIGIVDGTVTNLRSENTNNKCDISDIRDFCQSNCAGTINQCEAYDWYSIQSEHPSKNLEECNLLNPINCVSKIPEASEKFNKFCYKNQGEDLFLGNVLVNSGYQGIAMCEYVNLNNQIYFCGEEDNVCPEDLGSGPTGPMCADEPNHNCYDEDCFSSSSLNIELTHKPAPEVIEPTQLYFRWTGKSTEDFIGCHLKYGTTTIPKEKIGVAINNNDFPNTIICGIAITQTYPFPNLLNPGNYPYIAFVNTASKTENTDPKYVKILDKIDCIINSASFAPGEGCVNGVCGLGDNIDLDVNAEGNGCSEVTHLKFEGKEESKVQTCTIVMETEAILGDPITGKWKVIIPSQCSDKQIIGKSVSILNGDQIMDTFENPEGTFKFDNEILQSIDIFPKNKKIIEGTQIAYATIAIYDNGEEKDVTEEPETGYTGTPNTIANNPNIKNIFIGRNPGNAIIETTFSSKVKNTNLEVKPDTGCEISSVSLAHNCQNNICNEKDKVDFTITTAGCNNVDKIEIMGWGDKCVLELEITDIEKDGEDYIGTWEVDLNTIQKCGDSRVYMKNVWIYYNTNLLANFYDEFGNLRFGLPEEKIIEAIIDRPTPNEIYGSKTRIQLDGSHSYYKTSQGGNPIYCSNNPTPDIKFKWTIGNIVIEGDCNKKAPLVNLENIQAKASYTVNLQITAPNGEVDITSETFHIKHCKCPSTGYDYFFLGECETCSNGQSYQCIEGTGDPPCDNNGNCKEEMKCGTSECQCGGVYTCQENNICSLGGTAEDCSELGVNDCHTSQFACYWEGLCKSCLENSPLSCSGYDSESACDVDRCNMGSFGLGGPGECSWNGDIVGGARCILSSEGENGATCQYDITPGECENGRREIRKILIGTDPNCNPGETYFQKCGVEFARLPFLELWQIFIIFGLLTLYYIYKKR
ncbi:MAG: hypothetical protein ABH817_00575 [archaeon]